MRTRILKIFIFTFFLFPIAANAQRDTIKVDKVDIYTKYRPVLTDARKVESQPELEEPVIKELNFTYTFPDLRYKVQPAFTPIAGQEYRNKTVPFINGNFIKVGFGNYATPLLHLELHNGKNPNYAYGVKAHHVSSTGKPAFKTFIDDDVLVHGAKFMNGNTLSGQLGYSRFGYNYYGYDHEKNTFKRDSVKQAMNTISANIHYDNIKTSSKVKTGFDIDFNRFSIVQQNEIGYRIGNKTGGKVGNGELSVNIAFEGFASGPDSVKYVRNYIDINPVYKMRYKDVDLTMGAFASVFLDSGIAADGFYIYPEFKVDYYVVPEKMKAYVGLGGGLTKGSTRTLFNENPFLAENQNLENTYTPYIIFGGIKGKLGSGFDYILELSQQSIYNLPLYVSDTFALHKFLVLYDDVNLFKFTTGLNYNRFNKFNVSTNFIFYAYNTTTPRAYQRPNFEWNTNVSGLVAEKLKLHTGINVIGTRYGYLVGSLSSKELPVIADINIGADYRFKKHLSFFVNLNNLTNSTYQRWFNYPAYGLNGVGGVTFIF